MLAAAYARFSSDSQREESIEIQVSEIERLVESKGWKMGPIYTDYAVSGTREDRPGFSRCIEDGIAGAYQVLVVYKMDRFARNVAYAQETKRRLFSAGVSIWSVREGEVSDTPEGFLLGGVTDIYAEYYSRNLSVMVRNGIRKSARERKAAGRRIYGYAVDADDRFVEDPDTAAVVRSIFADYASGLSANQISGKLNSAGIRTLRGKEWAPNNISRLLSNDAYVGVYRYCGEEEAGAMPAIVDRALFDKVQETKERRKSGKRRRVVNDYVLTDKVWCLECGGAMCGTAGTSATGRKYTYYGCMNKGGCGLRVPSGDVEAVVANVIAGLLSDPATLDAMARDMVEYVESLPDRSGEYLSEAASQRKRRDRLVESIVEGVPASAVAEAIAECENRIAELESLLAVERQEREQIVDVESARAFIESLMANAADDPEGARILAEGFVDRVYVDKGRAVIALAVGDAPDEWSVEEMRAIADGAPTTKPVASFALGQEKSANPSDGKVRAHHSWWGTGTLSRTLVAGKLRYAVVAGIPERHYTRRRL